MATQQKSLPAKPHACAVNRPRWARLIPDQPECKKLTVRPAAALCARHEKMLPEGWRKLDADRPRTRSAKANGVAKPKAEKDNVVEVDFATDGTPIPAHVPNTGQDTHALVAFATPELAAMARAKRAARRTGAGS